MYKMHTTPYEAMVGICTMEWSGMVHMDLVVVLVAHILSKSIHVYGIS